MDKMADEGTVIGYILLFLVVFANFNAVYRDLVVHVMEETVIRT